jgi:hypothetical protein
MLLAASAVSRPTLRRLALTTLAAATLALSACGGGDRAVEYKPTAMLVFGDEHSAFHTVTVPGVVSKPLEQLTWGIDLVGASLLGYCSTPSSSCVAATSTEVFTNANPVERQFDAGSTAQEKRRTIWFFSKGALASTPNVTTYRLEEYLYGCPTSTIWVQSVANAFGLGFGAREGCAGDRSGASNFAAPGDKVANVIAKLRQQRGLMKEGVLVTVMVGQNDILERYKALAPGFVDGDVEREEAALRALGDQLALEIREVTNTGAKVILAKTPNLQRSPFAVGDGGNGAVLGRLSNAFNDALYINPAITRLGRSIAGVDTNEVTLASSSNSGYTNDVAACSSDAVLNPGSAAANPVLTRPAAPQPIVAPDDPDFGSYAESFRTYLDVLMSYYSSIGRLCTTQYVQPSINPSNYVWATPIHLGPGAHSYIGSVAFNRAANQF